VPELSGLLDVSLGHEVLDLLDRQLIDRWRVALGLLGEVDGALADDVRAALTRVVYLDGEPVPAWDSDTLETTTLAEGLLGASVPEQRASVARRWLARQDSIRVWIEDDFASMDRGTRIARLGAANLRGVEGRVEMLSGDALTGESTLLEAYESAMLEITVGDDGLAQLVREDVRVPLEGLLEPIALAPPGGRLGPLLRPWTMETWLDGRAGGMHLEWMSMGLLYPDPEGDEVLVYLECRVPEDFFVGSSEQDVVRLWFGPRGASEAVLHVASRGGVHDEISGEDFGEASRIRRERDRWSAIVPVPRFLVEGRSGLLLGVERVHGGGGRSTWPRPVFPWESEPSRAYLEIDGWDVP
jgi:hypothetical protein